MIRVALRYQDGDTWYTVHAAELETLPEDPDALLRDWLSATVAPAGTYQIQRLAKDAMPVIAGPVEWDGRWQA